MRKLVELRKNEDDMINIVQFITDFKDIKDTHIVIDRGIRSYTLYSDGHASSGNYQRCMFPNGVEYGNNKYKEYLQYKVFINETFEPTRSDMR